MSLNLQTVETTADLDENGVLHVKEPIRGLEAGEVLVIVVARAQHELSQQKYDDISSNEWNRAMTNSSALEFLHSPEEDVYTLEDGEPVEWEAK
jgi:hypothetical protein